MALHPEAPRASDTASSKASSGLASDSPQGDAVAGGRARAVDAAMDR